ncbi:MAG: DsrE/DsrF/DrsH-like family protein [Cellulosilyticaceae bacterium]
MSKVAIIAANGTLFDAYKVFNIAVASASTDYEVSIFFTFDGLNLIHKEANKSLPLPVGKEGLAAGLANANLPTIPELVAMATDLNIKFIACQMTMDLFNLEQSALVDDIEVGGAVTFLDYAKDAQVVLTF